MPNPKILVVDDEGSIRFALRDFLDSGGYDVVEAESLAQADIDSPIAGYVGLVGDITLLIGSADTAVTSAACFAQRAAVERK